MKVNDLYIDITADQFPELTDDTVVIESTLSDHWLTRLFMVADRHGTAQLYVAELYTENNDYTDLYDEIVSRIMK
ncbi:hypothetical protein [Shewanella surugensis]|uniref:Uncharacterized protein n=1 Tax=Shewanella surugensis TaxID=212020 RepID=A0ABT0LAQ5_9GAMM|nr:hypothetical protein [Shewanella surugensis]MCL1124753.1 hypothetical protein [Shewanella surugensis]